MYAVTGEAKTARRKEIPVATTQVLRGLARMSHRSYRVKIGASTKLATRISSINCIILIKYSTCITQLQDDTYHLPFPAMASLPWVLRHHAGYLCWYRWFGPNICHCWRSVLRKGLKFEMHLSSKSGISSSSFQYLCHNFVRMRYLPTGTLFP